MEEFRAQELCENRGSRPGHSVPKGPYGLCGRKATLEKEDGEIKTCRVCMMTWTKPRCVLTIESFSSSVFFVFFSSSFFCHISQFPAFSTRDSIHGHALFSDNLSRRDLAMSSFNNCVCRAIQQSNSQPGDLRRTRLNTLEQNSCFSYLHCVVLQKERLCNFAFRRWVGVFVSVGLKSVGWGTAGVGVGSGFKRSPTRRKVKDTTRRPSLGNMR